MRLINLLILIIGMYYTQILLLPFFVPALQHILYRHYWVYFPAFSIDTNIII